MTYGFAAAFLLSAVMRFVEVYYDDCILFSHFRLVHLYRVFTKFAEFELQVSWCKLVYITYYVKPTLNKWNK